MQVVLSFIGIHFVTQLLLIIVYFKQQFVVDALFEFYNFSPGLFYFLALGIGAQLWVIWSWIEYYLLRLEVGRKGRRAAGPKGEEEDEG